MERKMKESNKSSNHRKKKENNNDVLNDGMTKKVLNGETNVARDPYEWEDDQSPSAEASIMTEEERRRFARNKLEKHRKDKIRGWVQQLIELLPPVHTGKKAQNTNDVLERTTHYVRELQMQNDQLMRNYGDQLQAEEIARLRKDLNTVTKERDQLDKMLQQATMSGQINPKTVWQTARNITNAERRSKNAQEEPTCEGGDSSLGEEQVSPESKKTKLKRNKSGKTIKSHIEEVQKNSDFVSLATARSLADQLSVVTSHDYSNHDDMHSISSGNVLNSDLSKASFVDSNGMLMVSPTAAAQSLFSNVSSTVDKKSSEESTNNSETTSTSVSEFTSNEQNDALNTLATVATIATVSSSAADITLPSMFPQAEQAPASGTQVTQSVGMPIMSADSKAKYDQTFNAGTSHTNVLNQTASVHVQNNTQPGSTTNLQGTLVMQNGQLILIKDPVMPLQSTASIIENAGHVQADVAKSVKDDCVLKDGTTASMLPPCNPSQEAMIAAQNGMLFPTSMMPRPQMSQPMFNTAGQQLVPLSNGQFGVLNNPQQSMPMLGQQPMAGLGMQPNGIIANPNQPHLPQALILPNGQVVPVVTQPSLLFPQGPNPGLMMNPNNPGALMSMSGAGMIPGVNMMSSGTQSLPGGLLMTTSITTVTTTTAVSSCSSHIQVVGSQMGSISSAAPSQSSATTLTTNSSSSRHSSTQHMLPPVGQPVVMNPTTGQPQLMVGQPQLLMNQNQLTQMGIKNTLGMPLGQQLISSVTDSSKKTSSITAVPTSTLQTTASSLASGATVTSTASTSNGPTTLRVVSSNGTFLITLPPGVNPQNLIIDPNNLAALQQQKPACTQPPPSTVTTTVPLAGGKNKKGQRILMPKPPNHLNFIPPITMWPMPAATQEKVHNRSNRSRSQGDKQSAIKTDQASSANKTDSVGVNEGSPAVDSNEKEVTISEIDVSSQPVTVSMTEDILAKATESIFSTSMSDISPTIYDHDENDLYIDTSTMSIPEPEAIAPPVSDTLDTPVITKKSHSKSKSRRKKSANKVTDKLKLDVTSSGSTTAVSSSASSEPITSTVSITSDSMHNFISERVMAEPSVSPIALAAESPLQAAPSMPMLVPDATPNMKQMTRQERREVKRLAKRKEREALRLAKKKNVVKEATELKKTDCKKPSYNKHKDKVNESLTDSVSEPSSTAQRIDPHNLPDTITFTESELSDVLDQVENLGMALNTAEKPRHTINDGSNDITKMRNRKNKSDVIGHEDQPVSKKRKHAGKNVIESIAQFDTHDDILPNDTGLQIDLDPPSLEINEQSASPNTSAGNIESHNVAKAASPKLAESPLPHMVLTSEEQEKAQVHSLFDSISDMIQASPAVLTSPVVTSPESHHSSPLALSDSIITQSKVTLSPSLPPPSSASLEIRHCGSSPTTNLNILSSIATLEALERADSASLANMHKDDDNMDPRIDKERADSPLNMRPESPMRIPMDTPMPPICRSPPPRMNSPPQLQSHSMSIDSPVPTSNQLHIHSPPLQLQSPQMQSQSPQMQMQSPTQLQSPVKIHSPAHVKRSPAHSSASNNILSPAMSNMSSTSMMSPQNANVIMLKSSPSSSYMNSSVPTMLQHSSPIQSPMSSHSTDHQQQQHRRESYGSQGMGPPSIDNMQTIPQVTSPSSVLKQQSSMITHASVIGNSAPFLSHSAESLFSPASMLSKKEPMKGQEAFMDTPNVPQPAPPSQQPQQQSTVQKTSPAKSPARSGENSMGNTNKASRNKTSSSVQQQSMLPRNQSSFYSGGLVHMPPNSNVQMFDPRGKNGSGPPGMFNSPPNNMMNNQCGMQRPNNNNFNMQHMPFMPPNMPPDGPGGVPCTGPFSMASTLPAFSFSLSGSSASNPNSFNPSQFPFYPLHPPTISQPPESTLNIPPIRESVNTRNNMASRTNKHSNDTGFNNSSSNNFTNTSPRDSMRNALPRPTNQFMETVPSHSHPKEQCTGPPTGNEFPVINPSRTVPDMMSVPGMPGLTPTGPGFNEMNHVGIGGSSGGPRVPGDIGNRLTNHYADISHARTNDLGHSQALPQSGQPQQRGSNAKPAHQNRQQNVTPPVSRPAEISTSHRRPSDSGQRLTEIGQSQHGSRVNEINRSPVRARDSNQPQKRLGEIAPPVNSVPPRTRSNPPSQTPQVMNSMGPPFYPPSFPNQMSPANQMTSPPLHHPNRRPSHPGETIRPGCVPTFHPPAPDFNPVLNFGAGGFDPPPLELNVRETNSTGVSASQATYPQHPQASPRNSKPTRGETSARTKSNTTSSRPSTTAAPKSQKSRAKSNKKQQQQNKHYEMDTNLANSIFESSRSMTPYFHLGGMPSPPARNLQSEGPTYLPGNLFPGPSRPLSNTSSAQHKNPEMNPAFNPLFNPARSQNGLGLNFQPGFGMNPMHPSHPNSGPLPPHSNSLTMPPHLSNFNLSNIFSDINNPGQSDAMNISPIKFAHGNPMIPPQPGMDHNALQHHHHQGAIYHNRAHPQMIHSFFGHNHPGLEGRPMGPGGIAQFHGHGSTPTFGMPGLNFNMHEH